MRKSALITLIALLAIVAALPLYAWNEPTRMQQAELALRETQLENAAEIYVASCATCHGVAGEGTEAMPALNNPALAGADPELLYKVIARAAHGTTMAAWHIDEGGVLSSYQIDELVVLLRFGDWNKVASLAQRRSVAVQSNPFPDMEEVFLTATAADPHQCVACHEDPAVHAGRFGLQCARCHTTVAWTPAMLTRHIFALDHGDAGNVACETCHTITYVEYTCYGCHDHVEEDMVAVHLEQNITELEPCASCHPTGAPDEAVPPAIQGTNPSDVPIHVSGPLQLP